MKKTFSNQTIKLYYPLISILILLYTSANGQSYTVNIGGYSGSASYSPQSYSIGGPFGSMSGSSSTFTTTSVPTSFSITFYSSFYGNTCTLSGTVNSSICSGSGSYNTTTGSCGGGGASAGISLSAGPNLTINGTASGTYCASQQITINASPGFGTYRWYYKTQTGAWTAFATNTATTYSFGVQDVFGSSYPSYLNQNLYFAYGINGCGMGPALPSAYVFAPEQVTVSTLPNSLSISLPKCLGGSDGSASVLLYSRPEISGEIFTFEVHSAPTIGPSTLVSATALSSGTYYVLAVSNLSGCGSASFTPVVIPPGPRTSVTSSASVTSSYNGAQISCVGSGDGEITIALPTGGDGNFKYFINNVQQPGRINSVGEGTHIVRVEDGCSTPNTYVTSVTVSAPPVLVLDPLIPSYCNSNTTTGEITVTKTGGTGSLSDFTYSYDGQPFESSSVKTGLTTGIIHTVVAKDKNGCISLPADVTIPNPLSGSSSVTNPTCGTGTGTVQINTVAGGTAPYTYSLNGATAVTGSTTNGHTFTGLPSGTNAVTLYDNKGCNTAFSSLAVTIPPLITVSALTTKVSCLGGSNGTITATALNTVGAVQYSLDGGTTYQASNQFVNKTIGSAYRVTVKDANSCVMQSGFILVDQIPTLTGTVLQTTNILCHGDTGVKGASLDLTPTGGTPDGDYIYQWSNNATSQDVTGLSAGTYSVTIKDKNLCSTTLPNIVVSEPALLSSSLVKTDVSCNPSHGTALSSNGAINLIPAGGTGAYHYNWSTNAITEDISNLTAGTYDVTITDDNGCTTTNAATLTQPLAVTSLVDTFNDITCKGLNNGSVTLLATGGTSVFSYSLNGTAWQGSPVFSGLMPNNYTFYTRDQKGCATQLNKAIAEPDVLVATVVNIEGTTCGNSNGSAQVNVTGGNGNYQYAWKNTFNQIVGTSNVLSDASGDAYTIVVVDSKNCSDTKSALISNSDGAQIQINSVDPTSCYDTHDGKARITVSAGVAPYSITWDNTETGLTPTALLPGDNIVRVSDANNCVAVKLVAIPFPDAIAIDTKVITPPTCAGSTDAGITLTMKGGNGSYTYAWSNGSTTSLINTVAAGDYGVTVKDIKNCTYTSSIKIDAIPELKLSVVNEKLPTCFDGADGALTVGTSGGNGNYSYQWTAGPAAPEIENINAGPYTVKVTDVKGCNQTSTFTLNNPVKFNISIEDKTICVGQKFKIASDVANGSYSWTSAKGFSSTQQEVTLTDPDVYTLKVINAQGCEAQDSFNLITSTELLHADLIMISEAYTADTVVVIDLSWPLPDVTTWLFPTRATVVEENNQLGYAFLQFPQQGQYDVAIRASLGDCVDTYSQAIKIKEGGVTNSGGRQSSMNVIQYFEVYPNPNKGEFTVVTDLYEVQSVRLTLVNVEGNKVLLNQYAEGKSSYNWQVSLPDLTQGTYFLVLKAGKETKAVRMMKL